MAVSTRKLIQILMLIAIVAAAVRLAYVLRLRHEPLKTGATAQLAAPPLNPEYYVTPKKLYAYDLKSARQLTQQPEWMKEGYRYTYYPYDRKRRRADFANEAGTLGPIQKVEITEVVAQPSPSQKDVRQVLGIFDLEGKSYAVPVGIEHGGDYTIYADQMFYYQDPHKLYDFWPAEVWDAIDHHQVKPGMDELQVSMAVGMGTPQPSAEEGTKVVQYPNGGHTLTVTYRNNKAAEVKERGQL